LAQACTDEGREAELPDPDRLVCHLIAALAEQLGDIAEAEFVAEAPEDGHRTMSVGNRRSLKGVPVRSLSQRWHDRHENLR